MGTARDGTRIIGQARAELGGKLRPLLRADYEAGASIRLRTARLGHSCTATHHLADARTPFRRRGVRRRDQAG